MQARVVAAQLVGRVRGGASLSRELPRELVALPARERSTVQALVYGCLRLYERIDGVLSQLLRMPLKTKDEVIGDLLRIALFELLDAVTPEYAVVDGVVAEAKRLRPWSAGLVNACLRRFLRERAALLEQANRAPEARCLLPAWLLERLQHAWPDDWKRVAEAFAAPAPLTLRVNLARCEADEYARLLEQAGIGARRHPLVPGGLVLDRQVDVATLPNYAEGWIYVQDAGAQLAAPLLAPVVGERVIDACAAPGGKSIHLLEHTDGRLDLWALESDPARLVRLEENLARAHYGATVKLADAAAVESWWDGVPFHRVLLDAPCSGTGVIRRHPDIKRLRRDADIQALVQQQRRLLDALWRVLAPGGIFLYTTCSILPDENTHQISAFLQRHEDAEEVPIGADWGRSCPHGRQILPGEAGMDGFYYACVVKRA